MRPLSILILLTAGLPVGHVEAQTPAAPDLHGVAFMTGCWEGPFQSRGRTGTIQEQYTSPSANVMLGTTRYLLGDITVQFELTTLIGDSTGVVMTPYPRGRPSADGFRLVHAEGDSAVFVAPGHDFPKRIIYRLRSGKLIARIDDGADAGQAMVWKMERGTGC